MVTLFIDFQVLDSVPKIHQRRLQSRDVNVSFEVEVWRGAGEGEREISLSFSTVRQLQILVVVGRKRGKNSSG